MTAIALLSHQEERVLRLRAEGKGISECAAEIGISDQTVKNHLTSVYHKLDVTNGTEAMRALGWLKVPGKPIQTSTQCDFVGRCGRAAGHRGQHGGFRPHLVASVA